MRYEVISKLTGESCANEKGKPVSVLVKATGKLYAEFNTRLPVLVVRGENKIINYY